MNYVLLLRRLRRSKYYSNICINCVEVTVGEVVV